MSSALLKEMLASGRLQKLSLKCKTQKELANRLGLSEDAYTKAARRIRDSGISFPTFIELQGIMPASNTKPNNNPPTAAEIVEDELSKRKERARASALESKLKSVLEELEKCKLELSTVTEAREHHHVVTPIKPREKSGKLREATAVALASDWHIEETVEPEMVNGVNEYNVDIARTRVQRFFEGLLYMIGYHTGRFAIRDLLLWLGGDLITGYLREENLEANGLSPVQAIAILHVWLAEGIRSILKNTKLELLTIVCNSGNHGRLTDKIRPGTRERNSIEWLLYTELAREFKDEKRVKFVLPRGSQTYINVYDFTIRFLHGDDVNYKGGVGGITIPLYKALARWETVRHAHLTCLGHFHQYHDLSDLVVNGSLIGFNPYALSIGARYEVPRQAFFLIDKKRGKTFPADIWVTD
jgi:hypothetical protein